MLEPDPDVSLLVVRRFRPDGKDFPLARTQLGHD